MYMTQGVLFAVLFVEALESPYLLNEHSALKSESVIGIQERLERNCRCHIPFSSTKWFI